MARNRFAPTFVTEPNGKPVAMEEVFCSMSELSVTQHLSGLQYYQYLENLLKTKVTEFIFVKL